jgi:hypothetical protein
MNVNFLVRQSSQAEQLMQNIEFETEETTQALERMNADAEISI